MNAAAAFPARPRRAASPYARRLARERGLALDTLGGSGPGGRILAADVLAFRQPDPPPAHLAAGPPLVFSAAVSLAALARLAADAARAGFVIGLEDAALLIRVRDTGIGIPPEVLPRIFEPFYRGPVSRRFPQGMGLGLSIARDLVNAHGGRIDVESVFGEGSLFTIRLPLDSELPASAPR